MSTELELRPHYGSNDCYANKPDIKYNLECNETSDEDVEKPWYEKIPYTGNLTEDEQIEEIYVQREIERIDEYYEKVKSGEIDPNDYIKVSDSEDDLVEEPEVDDDNYYNDYYDDYSDYELYDRYDFSDDEQYIVKYDDNGNEIIESDCFGDDEYDDEEDESAYTGVKASRQWGYL